MRKTASLFMAFVLMLSLVPVSTMSVAEAGLPVDTQRNATTQTVEPPIDETTDGLETPIEEASVISEEPAHTASGPGDTSEVEQSSTEVVHVLGEETTIRVVFDIGAVDVSNAPAETTFEVLAGNAIASAPENPIPVHTSIKFEAWVKDLAHPAQTVVDLSNPITTEMAPEGVLTLYAWFVSTASVTEVELSATHIDGSAFDAEAWDYATNKSYYTIATITPSASGTNRFVLLSPPETMKFTRPVDIAGVTFKMDKDGKSVIATLADAHTDVVSFSLTTSAAAGNTASNIGGLIKTASIAGEAPYKAVTKAVVTENGTANEPVVMTVTPKIYKQEDIFQGLKANYYSGGNYVNNFFISQWGWPYGKRHVLLPLQYTAFYLRGTDELHEPFWDLSVKVYIPDGMTVNNHTIYTEEDTNARYILFEKINEGGFMPTGDVSRNLEKMTSPENKNLAVPASQDNINTPTPPSEASLKSSLAGYNTGGALFGTSIDFALTEELIPQKPYNAKTIVEYTTAQGTYTQEVEPISIITDNVTQGHDTYTINAKSPLDFIAGRTVDTATTAQAIQITTAGLWEQVNEQHENGTLTLDIGKGIQISDMTMPNAASVSYVLTDGETHTASATDTTWSFSDATSDNRVTKIIVKLDDNGLDLMPQGGTHGYYAAGTKRSLPLTFTITGDTGLEDNVPNNPGVHQTSITVTLRGQDGCAEYNGQGKTPKVTNGEHKIEIPVTISDQQDLVLVYAGSTVYGGGNSVTLLSGQDNQKVSTPAARVFFGWNTFDSADPMSAKNYKNKPNLWRTYTHVSMDISSDALAAFYPEITVDGGLLMQGGRFVYTTGKGLSGIAEIPDNGTLDEYGELSGGSGTAQTISFPLDEDDWIETLAFEAEVFKPIPSSVPYDMNFRNTTFTFYSFAERNFRNTGEPIRHFQDEQGPYTITATMTADEITGSRVSNSARSNTSTDFFTQYLKLARYTNKTISVYSTSYTDSRAYVSKPSSTTQGKNFSITVASSTSVGGGAGSGIVNSEIWLKVNPLFAYADDKPNITVRTVGDDTWLILKEDPFVNGIRSYAIDMFCLPTTPIGSHNVFEVIYRKWTDSCDFEYASQNYPYVVYTAPNHADIVSDPLDIDGDGRTDNEVLLRTTYDTNSGNWNPKTPVSYSFAAGVSVIGGKSTSYTQSTTSFVQTEADMLSLLASIGGDEKNDVTEYSTIIQIPQKGDVVDGSTSDFSFKLRDAVSVSAGTVPYAVSYSADGKSFVDEAHISSIGNWDAVTYVKIFIEHMPGKTIVSVAMPLATRDFTSVSDGQCSYVQASYSFDNNGTERSGVSNVATYTAELYTLKGGYVFQDKDNSDTWSSGDKTWTGIDVELWNANKDGRATGAAPVAATKTAVSTGTFTFTDLYKGDYVIKVLLPSGGYAFCAANKNEVSSTNSHVDEAGFGPLIALDKDMKVVQNAGIQARYALTVEYRLADDSLVYSTGKTEKDAAETQAVVEYSEIEGYHLVSPDETSKQYTTTWANPEAIVVFTVAPNTRTVTFDANGGNGAMSNQTTTYDKNLTLNANTYKKVNYAFGGWNTSPAGTGDAYADMYTFEPWNLTKDITLYAQWSPIDATVQFFYNANDGDMTHYVVGEQSNKNIKQGETLASFASPTRAGYTFVGWFDARKGGVKYTPGASTVNTEKLNLFAQWAVNSYTVRFLDYDGSYISEHKVAFAAATPIPANPVRTGYIFSNWTPNVAATVTHDATYTAQYTEMLYTITYSPGLYGAFAEQSNTDLVYGALTPDAPTANGQEGWRFTGWEPSVAETVTADITYVAQWEKDNEGSSGGSTEPLPPSHKEEERQNEAPPTKGVTRGGAPIPPNVSEQDAKMYEAQTGNVIVDILNGNVPLGGMSLLGTWSLASLIMALLSLLFTLAIGIKTALGKIRRKNTKDETAQKSRYHKRYSVALLLLVFLCGVAPGILFIVLDNISNPISLINHWTPFVFVAFLVHLIVTLMQQVCMFGEVG